MLNTVEARTRLKQLEVALANHPALTAELQAQVELMAIRIDALAHDARALINRIETMEGASW